MENQGTIVINQKQENFITLNSIFHIPSMKKNLFSITNAIEVGNFVL